MVKLERLPKVFMREIQRDHDIERGHSPESAERIFYQKMGQILEDKLGAEKASELIDWWMPFYLDKTVATLALCVDRYPSELKSLVDEHGLREKGEPTFFADSEKDWEEIVYYQGLGRVLARAIGYEGAKEKIKERSPFYREMRLAILTLCLEICPAELKQFIDEYGLKRDWGRFN